MATERKRRSARGQSLVEFVLSTAIFILLFSGVVDLGRAFFTLIALESVISEGAHWAAAYPDCVPTASDSQAGSTQCQGTNSIVGRMLNETTNLDPANYTEVIVTSDDVTRWVYNWNNGVPPKGETVLFRVSYRVETIMPVTRLLFGTHLTVTAQAREVVRGKGMPDYDGAPTSQGGVDQVPSPGAPAGLTQVDAGSGGMVCNNGQATVTWTAQITTGYRFYDAGSLALIKEVRPASVTSTEIPVGFGATRNILMKAFNQNNLREEEGPSISYTLNCPDVQPTTFVHTCKPGGMDLTWTASPVDAAVAGYALMRVSPATQVATFSGATTAAGSYIFLTGSDNPANYYMVAILSDGTPIGTTSNIEAVNCTLPSVPPAAVTNFRWGSPNVCSLGQATLAWDQSLDASGYNIYNESTGTIIANIPSSLTTTYTVTVGSGLTGSYSIEPYVYSASGNIPGPKSATITVSCPALNAPVLNTPSCGGLGAGGYTLADFTWTPYSGDVGVAGYKLYRSGSPAVERSSGIIALGSSTTQITLQAGDNPADFYLQLVDTGGNPVGTASALQALNCPAPSQVVIVSQPSCNRIGLSGTNRRYFWVVQSYSWTNPVTYVLRDTTNGNGPWTAESVTLNSPIAGQTALTIVLAKQSEGDQFSITAKDTVTGLEITNSTSNPTMVLGSYTNATCPN